MNAKDFYRLDSISVVDVIGADAPAIVHNLTTNEIRDLSTGTGRESFVADARGKTLAHVLVFREAGPAIRMIAAGGNSEKIAGQIDRYTIRENATPEIRDDEFTAFVVEAELAETATGASLPTANCLYSLELLVSGIAATTYQAPWLGDGSRIILVNPSDADALAESLTGKSLVARDEAAFHVQRTIHGFPWFGIDFDETNLPQEIARDAQTISLTKGCYLGQETVARLDALGQVQKKLLQWSIAGAVPEPGATLTADDKTVGRLTSVACRGDQDAIAIGFARRSHFDTGATARGVDARGSAFTGCVL